MTMAGGSREILRATRLTRTVVGAVGLLFVAAVLLRFAEKAIAVPELTKGIFKEETTVTIEMVPAPVKETIIEHTAEKSDFTIAAKPTPVKPVEAAPAPEVKPVEPEPAVKPKPVPKKAAEARKRVKPVSPKVKPQAPAAVEKTVPAEAQTGAGKGASAVAVNPEKAGNSAQERSKALAVIVAVINEHKRYPRRARQTGTEGEVLLTVNIDAAGTVTAVTVKKPHASVLLNRAARKAADALIGMKLAVTEALNVDVPVVFTLSGS